ncbi:hypothetical protein ACJX0J_018212, partial [Zea mays]
TSITKQIEGAINRLRGKPSGGGTASPNIIVIKISFHQNEPTGLIMLTHGILSICLITLPSWGMLPELELQDIHGKIYSILGFLPSEGNFLEPNHKSFSTMRRARGINKKFTEEVKYTKHTSTEAPAINMSGVC